MQNRTGGYRKRIVFPCFASLFLLLLFTLTKQAVRAKLNIEQVAEEELCGATNKSCAADADAVVNSPNVTMFATSCDGQFPETATEQQFSDLAQSEKCAMTAIKAKNCAGTWMVTANTNIVAGTAALTKQKCNFTITAFANGSHSTNSTHYSGNAIDIDVPSGCSTQKVLDAFCGRGLFVNSEGFTPGVDESNPGSHWHIGTDTFDDECP